MHWDTVFPTFWKCWRSFRYSTHTERSQTVPDETGYFSTLCRNCQEFGTSTSAGSNPRFPFCLQVGVERTTGLWTATELPSSDLCKGIFLPINPHTYAHCVFFSTLGEKKWQIGLWGLFILHHIVPMFVKSQLCCFAKELNIYFVHSVATWL